MNDDVTPAKDSGPSSTSKFKLFTAVGALGGLAASLGYGAWFTADQLRGELPDWTLGPWSANPTYVVFFGLYAAAIAPGLVAAQDRYLGRGIRPGHLAKVLAISTICGIVGGFMASNYSHMLISSEDPARFLGWTIGGAIIGLIVATAVINLPKPIGVLSGALGGFLGCAINYLVGFHPGVAAAGALIGFILAYMERTNRQAWLEIQLREDGRETPRTIEVTIGAKPILLGYGRDADVRLDALPGVPGDNFATIHQRGNEIVFTDLLSNQSRTLGDNTRFTLSNAAVRVCRK